VFCLNIKKFTREGLQGTPSIHITYPG